MSDGDPENITCQFCSESGFDLPGLKHHLLIGYCEVFNNIPSLGKAAEIHQMNAQLDVYECENKKRQC